jgi:hypothetical protein
MSLLAGIAIASGAIGLGKSIFGGLRANQGRKEYESLLNNLPKYEIPDEFKANVNLAKSAYQSGMPGADVAKNMIYSSTEAGLSRAEEASQSSIDLLGATTEMYAKELDSLNNMAYQDAVYRSQQLDRLSQANAMMGEQKSKQWEINKWNPAQMRLNMAQSKWQSGQSMVQGGLGDLFGSAMSFATSQAQMKGLNEVFGQGGAAGVASSGIASGGYNGIGIKANPSSFLTNWTPK